MAGAGESRSLYVVQSRSLYVVQRHFRRVRRGYDPEEVDRHLHVVS
jgi:DivIVA domain-containing protein